MFKGRPLWFWPAFIGSFAMMVLIAVNYIAVLNKPADEKQIRDAIEEMRIASIEGRPGGVQEYLSARFELPEGTPETGGLFQSPRAKVADAIRKSDVESLQIENIRIEISGATAVAHCDVSAKFQYLTFPPVDYAANDIQIDFRKETVRRLFIIPESKWLVVGFSNVRFSDLAL
jgi:hypothetical protein